MVMKGGSTWYNWKDGETIDSGEPASKPYRSSYGDRALVMPTRSRPPRRPRLLASRTATGSVYRLRHMPLLQNAVLRDVTGSDGRSRFINFVMFLTQCTKYYSSGIRMNKY